ncbi:hypothetical protein EVAR_57587_1 [Eumeta japonica]|uniref:Uncharacterized protein n=1 Tax=Eumeta variegata TaxID=151549 RepID=A0A4C1Z9N4_EUMVA|nr:hypothetical protein EVAR_57587_1 [Eumeta japonica]
MFCCVESARRISFATFSSTRPSRLRRGRERRWTGFLMTFAHRESAVRSGDENMKVRTELAIFRNTLARFASHAGDRDKFVVALSASAAILGEFTQA